MASSEPLPDDMLVEIMSRSPNVHTLAKMRSTSKLLNSESYTSAFTPAHLVSGFLFECIRHNKCYTQFIDSCTESKCSHQSFSPFNFLPQPVKILASSDTTGLFYCESTEARSFNHYICKPATREWLQIPTPATENESWFYTMRAGLVVIGSSPLHYKVIIICRQQPSEDCNAYDTLYKTHVFDSQTPDKWKLLKQPLKIEGGYFEDLTLAPSVTVNGKLHFATTESRIACFDPLLEKWEVFSMPEACITHSLRPKLTKYNGKLGLLLDQDTNSVLFWVMEDYNNKVWSERSIVCPGAVTGSGGSTNVLGFCSTDAALFQIDYTDAVIYSLNENRRGDRMIKSRKIGDYLTEPMFIRSDFEKLGWKTEADDKDYRKGNR